MNLAVLQVWAVLESGHSLNVIYSRCNGCNWLESGARPVLARSGKDRCFGQVSQPILHTAARLTPNSLPGAGLLSSGRQG